jgi:TPP-dependent pyruvate/acetoin dehydrogenase alpha subunit
MLGYTRRGEVSSMMADLWHLYGLMLRSRLFEEATAHLWNDGLISGELHLGTGEEAVVAGIVSNLRDGDAMALDHRGTSALLMRGVDPGLLLRELLGRPQGLCGGAGGHMHLFAREILAASSGIVGAAGPAGAGFALAAEMLRPGTVAVAFLGEGAMNQGMVMESMNLAAVWKLPVLFACKDDGWSITTPSPAMTAATLDERASGLGVPAFNVDGLDAVAVWKAAREAIESARSGAGPTFLHMRCVHLEGHFLGFPLIRMARNPLGEVPGIMGPLARSFLEHGGASLTDRWKGVKAVAAASLATLRDPRREPGNDPVARLRSELTDQARLRGLEDDAGRAVAETVAAVLSEAAS